MNSDGQNIGYKADDLMGHAAHSHGQMKKDDQHSSHSAQEALDRLSNTQSAQNTNIASQATNFIQQKGEQVINMAQGAGAQVKNMAQGAADAVKSTLGMNNENSGDYTRPNTNNPTNPSTRI